MDTVTLDFASLTNECKQNVDAILRGMPQESGSSSQHWFYMVLWPFRGRPVHCDQLGFGANDGNHEEGGDHAEGCEGRGTLVQLTENAIQAANDKDDAHEKAATAAKAKSTTKRSGAK